MFSRGFLWMKNIRFKIAIDWKTEATNYGCTCCNYISYITEIELRVFSQTLMHGIG